MALIPRPPLPAACAAAKNSASASWSLRPGSDSTPLTTSTANGAAIAIALATLAGPQAARKDGRNHRAPVREEVPVEGLPRPAVEAAAPRVEEVQVGAECLGAVNVGRAGDADPLHHLGAGAPRDLGAESRALVAAELDHRQLRVLHLAPHLLQRRVDEDADNLAAPAQRRPDLSRDGRVAAPRALLA